MAISMINTPEYERADLNFSNVVIEKFSFLLGFGFVVYEVLPTIVYYQKDTIKIDIYHGRSSYEIGLGITWHNSRYNLSSFMAVADLQAAKAYRQFMASNLNEVIEGTTQLAELTRRYCGQVFQGDAEFFTQVEKIHESVMQKYWLEMRASQVRPKANEAFRLGEYLKAAELYQEVEPVLSPSELKKLAIAKERSM